MKISIMVEGKTEKVFIPHLRGEDLSVAIGACPELKAFVNTILTLCGAPPIA